MVKRRIFAVLVCCSVTLICSPISGDGLGELNEKVTEVAANVTDVEAIAIEQIPAASKLGAGIPTAASPQDAVQKEAALNEILQIRQRLGGSVLEGTSLGEAVGEPSNGFHSSVRAHLGLPVAKGSNGKALNAAGSKASPTKRMSNQEVVISLRQESRSLSSLANDLETLRQYAHADALRATATKLRMIARQLDVAPDGKSPLTSAKTWSESDLDPTARAAN